MSGNIIQFGEARAERDAKDVPDEQPFFSLSEFAKTMWPKAEATVKIRAHRQGTLVRWAMETRHEVGIDHEIELLKDALMRAETARDLRE